MKQLSITTNFYVNLGHAIHNIIKFTTTTKVKRFSFASFEKKLTQVQPKVYMTSSATFVGPCPHEDRDYCIGSNFWKFYLIRISFTLGELIYLVKVFRLFRLEQIVLVCRVWTQQVDVQHFIYWQGQCVCDALFDYDVAISQELFTH